MGTTFTKRFAVFADRTLNDGKILMDDSDHLSNVLKVCQICTTSVLHNLI